LVAQHGHVKVAQLLLDTGKVDIDSNDLDGRMPLSWAAENGHVEVVHLLLDTDEVDINSDDLDGRTPLLWVVKNRHFEVVRLLNIDSEDIDSE
ncbi:ankyrin, partial [Periconia macrospinosa]